MDAVELQGNGGEPRRRLISPASAPPVGVVAGHSLPAFPSVPPPPTQHARDGTKTGTGGRKNALHTLTEGTRFIPVFIAVFIVVFVVVFVAVYIDSLDFATRTTM